MARYDVFIFEYPVSIGAAVNPGVLEVVPGDEIDFYNRTSSDATLWLAQDRVLAGVSSGQLVILSPSVTRGLPTHFTVDTAASVGVYEYQVLVTLRSGKKVFAVGESTPRIIIRPSSQIS